MRLVNSSRFAVAIMQLVGRSSDVRVVAVRAS
jgi:hypothetical protein